VLSAPSGDERILLETGEDRAVDAVEMAITQGLEKTMNVVNTDPEEAARKEAERLRRLKEREERERLRREAEEQQQAEQAEQGDTESSQA